MRIQATVELVNRDVNMKTKAVRASLAIGKRPDSDDAFIMMSTLNNKAGTKFAISSNVERVFARCAGDGKATIRFTRPAKDMILSKADPVQLKALLNVLKRIIVSKDMTGLNMLSALNPATTAQVTKPSEKLVVTNKRDYPITKNFPASLTQLTVNGVNLKRIDSRMLRLHMLSRLDLTDNSIADLSASFAKLANLREVVLAGNRIERVPAVFAKTLSSKVVLLDLSRNLLRSLPNEVPVRLSGLVSLNLAGNRLIRLPPSLGRLAKTLRTLDVSGNLDLKVFPGTFPRLSLDTLRLSSASILSGDAASVTLANTTNSVPTLTDLAMLACDRSNLRRVVGSDDLPPSLLADWDNLLSCSHCHKTCAGSAMAKAVTKSHPGKVAKTLVHDGNQLGSNALVRCESVFCSSRCLEACKNKPLDYR